jgi:hypothetical protein
VIQVSKYITGNTALIKYLDLASSRKIIQARHKDYNLKNGRIYWSKMHFLHTGGRLLQGRERWVF